MTTFETIRTRLAAIDQAHLLNFYSTLDSRSQAALLEQIAGLPLEDVPALVEGYVKHKPAFVLPKGVAPAPYYPHDAKAPGRAWDKTAAQAAGEKIIRAGQVAAFVVAGGQGSRLGYEGPRGATRRER